jgi:hypothetical protein
MYDVILSGPNNLDWCSNAFGNLHSLSDEIGLNTTAESAAYVRHMERNGFDRKSAYC